MLKHWSNVPGEVGGVGADINGRRRQAQEGINALGGGVHAGAPC